MKTHSHLLFIGVLVFVFPLVFLVSNQSFLSAAQTNANTAQKQRVGIMHDSLVYVLKETNVNIDTGLFFDLLDNNTDIATIAVFEATSEGYKQRFSSTDEYQIAAIDKLLDRALNDESESLIFEFYNNNDRIWTVVRKFSDDGIVYYLVSEHSLTSIDAVFKAREQQSYLVLTLIFAFLLALAYWLAKQVHWQQEALSLKKTLEERNLFTNMIAHEFRAPLTAINGYASFLNDAELKEKESSYVNNIQSSVERLLLLVNDFLEVARIQSGKISLDVKPESLEEIIDEVISTETGASTEKGLSLEKETFKKPVHIDTDRARLIQVLTNLVSNAIKYSEEGSIRLAVEQDFLHTTITIKDSGNGISASDQKKLFAPFVRVGGADASTTVGTGLGMWITKQLVELLGGEIGVESIKGVGTHVVITFSHKKLHQM